jgi:hypothetical protein
MTTESSLPLRIHRVRDEAVILDHELAALYGVSTKQFNQAFKRNRQRFPADFVFQLSAEEFAALRSQIVTSNPGRGGRRHLPWAFTEHGAVMAASILNSERAVAMSTHVVRTFVKLRREMLGSAVLEVRLSKIEKDLLNQNAALRKLYEKISPLLLPDPDEPRHGRKLGFHRGNR